MTETIVAIRPEPGLAKTIATARDGGVAIEGFALSEVRPLAWEPPPPGSYDALLLGSANALHHGGPALETMRGKPVFAVGETTADAARRAGFAVHGVGRGGLQGLLDTLGEESIRFLRLAGADRVPLKPPPGISIATRTVYASEPLEMPKELANLLRGRALVLLHSAASARHFASECRRLRISRQPVRIAALGPRIAAAAGEGWREVRSARNPRDSLLLALVRDMCHQPPPG